PDQFHALHQTQLTLPRCTQRCEPLCLRAREDEQSDQLAGRHIPGHPVPLRLARAERMQCSAPGGATYTALWTKVKAHAAARIADHTTRRASGAGAAAQIHLADAGLHRSARLRFQGWPASGPPEPGRTCVISSSLRILWGRALSPSERFSPGKIG